MPLTNPPVAYLYKTTVSVDKDGTGFSIGHSVTDSDVRTFRVSTVGVGNLLKDTWATDAAVNYVVYGNTGGGTSNFATKCLGWDNAAGANSVGHEKYNGNTWITLQALSLARRYPGGAGSPNAFLAYCGFTSTNTGETSKWDGSSWSIGSSATARHGLASAGTQNAAMAVGGHNGTSVTATTEKWNGNTWAVYSAGITSKYVSGGSASGTANAMLTAGGNNGSTGVTACDIFISTHWMSGPALTNACWHCPSVGTVNNTILTTGFDTSSYTVVTEKFLGIGVLAWRTGGSQPVARGVHAMAGTGNLAIAFGGWNGSAHIQESAKYFGELSFKVWCYVIGDDEDRFLTDQAFFATGEHVDVQVDVDLDEAAVFDTYESEDQLRTIERERLEWPTGDWIEGPTLPTARRGLSGLGTMRHALVVGGFTSSDVTTSNKLVMNGWSTTGAITEAKQFPGTAGSTQAGLIFGGAHSTNGDVGTTERFDGSSWSNASAALSVERYALGGAGTYNAALAFGGATAPGLVTQSRTDSWNGSTWTSLGDIATTRYALGSCGTRNAALGFGGTLTVGGTKTPITEKFNGTAWSKMGNMNVSRETGVGCGVQNCAMLFGGLTSGEVSTTERFNGYVWRYASEMISTINRHAGSGSGARAMSTGGDIASSNKDKTELFNNNLGLPYASEIAQITHSD